MLIGRGPELQGVLALLEGARGVAAVIGAAGLGKTALVRTVVEPDAVWIHGLATLRTRPSGALTPVLPAATGSLELDASHLVRHLGGRRLVVDDAQWVDAHTRAVVELVATTGRVCATWRTGDPAAPELPPGHWACLALAPLEPSHARVLACRTRPDLAEADLQPLLEVADGSPLLIQELAAGAGPSPNLVSALLPRLGGLPASVRMACLLVAAAEAGLPAEHVPVGLAQPLSSSGLAVLVGDQWWPRHALLQESLLEVAEPSEVCDAHVILADLLADDDPAAAARHVALAGRPEQAMALAERTLDLATTPIGRARAAVGMADLLERTDPEAAWRLRVDATSELRNEGASGDVLSALEGRPCVASDPERHGMAHCNFASAYWDHGDHERAHEHAQRALELVSGTDSEAELLVTAGLAMYSTRVHLDGLAALDRAREALRIARLRGVHVTYARTRVAAALLTSGDPAWRSEIDGAVAEAVEAGNDRDEILARENRYLHAFVTGDLDTALADLVAVSERDLDGRPRKARHAAFRLMLDLMTLGDRPTIVEAAQCLLADQPIFSQRLVAVAAGAVAAVDACRPDIAQDLLAAVDATDAEERLILAWASAELGWATGRGKAGDEGANEPTLAVHPAAVMASVINAWRAFEAGSSLPEPPLVVLPGFAPAAAEIAALQQLAVGEADAAVAAFDAAAARWWTGSDRRASIRCRWGAALASDLADAPDALDRLQHCWRDAVDHGLAPVAARAGRALRQRRVHTAPFPAPARAPLSACESQVLRLVAAGFTTEEVATALGVHSSTVGDHLHAAVARLGLRHRAEAVRWITAGA